MLIHNSPLQLSYLYHTHHVDPAVAQSVCTFLEIAVHSQTQAGGALLNI